MTQYQLRKSKELGFSESPREIAKQIDENKKKFEYNLRKSQEFQFHAS